MSKREIRARALLPRLAVRICCVDDGRGLAENLASWLESIGCPHVAVLDGGTKAWAAAGYELFSGVNVPSKAFGEWVEHHYGTESVDPPELKSWIDTGKNIVVLDSRTHEEFVRMSIPTGVSVPGGELVYRIGDIAPDPNTLVVVNRAGRTRSIMGAESLRRAGHPEQGDGAANGTMGWELAGFRCDRGRTDKLRACTPKTIATHDSAREAFAEESGVGVIGAIDLARFEDDDDRTLYVLDVARSAAVPARGIVPAASVRLVASWCRRRINGSACAMPGSYWWTIPVCVHAWPARGCVRWAIATCSSSKAGWRRIRTSGRERLPVPELGAKVATIDVTGLVGLLDSGEGTIVLDLAAA